MAGDSKSIYMEDKMSLGLPAALMISSIGPVDDTQYDPINKWS
ncbi:MAG: hypothetical protein WAM88_01445 [Nitrososphaeraceae archaeon]